MQLHARPTGLRGVVTGGGGMNRESDKGFRPSRPRRVWEVRMTGLGHPRWTVRTLQRRPKVAFAPSHAKNRVWL